MAVLYYYYYLNVFCLRSCWKGHFWIYGEFIWFESSIVLAIDYYCNCFGGMWNNTNLRQTATGFSY